MLRLLFALVLLLFGAAPVAASTCASDTPEPAPVGVSSDDTAPEVAVLSPLLCFAVPEVAAPPRVVIPPAQRPMSLDARDDDHAHKAPRVRLWRTDDGGSSPQHAGEVGGPLVSG